MLEHRLYGELLHDTSEATVCNDKQQWHWLDGEWLVQGLSQLFAPPPPSQSPRCAQHLPHECLHSDKYSAQPWKRVCLHWILHAL